MTFPLSDLGLRLYMAKEKQAGNICGVLLLKPSLCAPARERQADCKPLPVFAN